MITVSCAMATALVYLDEQGVPVHFRCATTRLLDHYLGKDVVECACACHVDGYGVLSPTVRRLIRIRAENEIAMQWLEYTEANAQT